MLTTKSERKQNMKDLIIIAILAVIAGLAAGYIWKAKKSGKTCIGCPGGSQCGGHCSSCSGCGEAQSARKDDDDMES